MLTGLDYSAGSISGYAITGAGYQFAIRYIDDPTHGLLSKHTTQADYAQLTATGVEVFLVFEIDTTDYQGGFVAGVANGTRALAGAHWVGHPGVIFAAIDTHLTSEEIPTALDYLTGFAHAVGAQYLGVYGFVELIEAAQKAGLGSMYWQCGVQPLPDSGVHIWQRNDGFVTVGGIECDVNDQLLPWPAVNATPSNDLATLDDLNRKLDDVLGFVNAIYQQMSGSMTLGQWSGWPSFPDGSGFSLTPVDYLRQADVQMNAVMKAVSDLRTEVDALKAQLAQIGGGSGH